jgi:hypothetical protein
MVKILLAIVVVAVAGVLVAAAAKPDTFRVQRSILVTAQPDQVFPLIADLHRFTTWSPYEQKDPAMERRFSGPEAGPGAQYAWKGNREIGEGSMEILSTSPNLVGMRLDFVKPFEAHNQVEFTLTPVTGGTQVTWALHGPHPLVARIMSLFFDMDRMVGADFEAGLANLKAAVGG